MLERGEHDRPNPHTLMSVPDIGSVDVRELPSSAVLWLNGA